MSKSKLLKFKKSKNQIENNLISEWSLDKLS